MTTYWTAQLLEFHDTMNKVSPSCAFSNDIFAFETTGGPEVNKATYEYHYIDNDSVQHLMIIIIITL